MSTWRRKAQELYPSLAGQLETWERIDWNYQFSRILSGAVAAENVRALADGIGYLEWCWSQHNRDEQFVYFVENALRQLLDRDADCAAFCRVADDVTFASVLAMYSRFHDVNEAIELEREYRFSHRPNTTLERTPGG